MVRSLSLIALFTIGITNIQASEESKKSAAQESAPQQPELDALSSHYVFTTDPLEYEKFLNARVAVGSEDYFAERDRVLDSVKGQPANKENIVLLYRTMNPFGYHLHLAAQEDMLLKEGKDAASAGAIAEQMIHDRITHDTLITQRPNIIVKKE